MILVKEMPTSGHFVAVWEYGGNVWSNTYYWEEDKLFCYTSETWELAATAGFPMGIFGVIYYTVG